MCKNQLQPNKTDFEEVFDPNETDFIDFYNKLLEVCKEFYLKQGFHERKILEAMHLAFPVIERYMEL